MDQAISKINALRNKKPELHISVDGGVNAFNAPVLLAAGANVLVAGGGIFTSADKKSVIQELLIGKM